MFEAFEASPQSESVLAAENALQWDFPGARTAAVIPFSTFSDPEFQTNLAEFLERASSESVKRFAARTKKAGYSTFESRDTGDPALITQMLMTLIEVNGHRISPVRLRKRVRDDVSWTSGSERPWRRCPLWLVLRVGLQRYLSSLTGGEQGRCFYKFLVCVVHAQLLQDSHHLNPELLFFLKAKLSRRVVKLQQDMSNASSATIQTTYRHMLDKLEPVFLKATQAVTVYVGNLWANFKKSIQRPILPLPQSAEPGDLYLRLPNSGGYLRSVLEKPLFRSRDTLSSVPRQFARKSSSLATSRCLETFSQRYFQLAEEELAIKRDVRAFTSSTITHEEGCKTYAQKISKYIGAVSKLYDDNSEQKGLMLLTVMELWMVMDQHACNMFSLLKEFNPGFPTEMLDVLQLLRFQDMERLLKIQTYLQGRHSKCGGCRMTVFDDPVQGCFAEQMYNSSSEMQELYRDVEAAAASARIDKEQQWRELSVEFDDLTHQISGMSHIYTTENSSFSQVHSRNCPKCQMEKLAGSMRIQIHEHPLPVSQVHAKAVIFELCCPVAFAAYRDATWIIISTLGQGKLIDSFEPKILLSEYSELKRYSSSLTFTLSLASTTKSFLRTHYSYLKFPVGLEEVCRPNGLKLGYYDTFSKVWPGRMQNRWPSFVHHCRIDKTCSTIKLLPLFSPDQNGPSSYEVLASQTQCPSGMNVHEYMAYQTLFSGRNRRWIVILNELGASNLNFSTEATYTLISHLTLHAGPQLITDSSLASHIGPLITGSNDPLRATHVIFRDNAFCVRLMEQLERRLDELTNNWRENFSMGTLLIMILRLCTLVDDPPTLRACERLLVKARNITHSWVSLLRTEIQKAVDTKTSQNCSYYALWAALLCHHTFSLYSTTKGDMDADDLCCFIVCSIAIQDNIAGDPSTFPLSTRNALIRDTKLIYGLRFVLRRSMDAFPEIFKDAVKTVWLEPEGSLFSRSFSHSRWSSFPDEWWFQTVIQATDQSREQTLQYHMLNGCLLIDGEPLGKLPPEYSQSVVLRELFGDQSLLAVPSPLFGMTHLVVMPIHGHQIHLGQRQGKTILRACLRDTILEFIPREVFYSSTTFDLPAGLVRGCVHWLDLRTGIMEIRKLPNIWYFKESNWRINTHPRNRRGIRRAVSLVDPQSRTFQRIASIFNQFEFPRELTVFQPSRRPLSVEVRRLELSFFVNRDQHLESSQLRSFIDPNQDAGTWYGLNSKLCLQDVRTGKRSVIVPFGEMVVKRNQFHVTIHTVNSGNYAKFPINDVLGRIESPMEPRTLFFKAQLHAFTSFIIPDPLTGRTGTEESLECLRSGYCQPWSPLKAINYDQILPLIAGLTPKRQYYPNDLRVMQMVIWDDRLTTTIQHDAFRGVVEDIIRKSSQLSTFATVKHELEPLKPPGDRHLIHRGHFRSCCFERLYSASGNYLTADDLPYEARDGFRANQGYHNVYESVTLIRKWAPKIPTTKDLAGILQKHSVLGGHNHCFDKILLTDRLTIAFGSEWGSLVELCKTCDRSNIFNAQFLFAVMAFGADVDMDLVRTLVAFAISAELKALESPKWPSYSQFRLGQVPHAKYLVQLIKGCCVPFTDNVLSELKYNLSFKQQKKLKSAEIAHEQQSENDCTTVAQFLFNQWPCSEISLEGSPDNLLIDMTKAMEIIRPEWERLFCNMQLTSYLRLVQEILDRLRTDEIFPLPLIPARHDDFLPTRVFSISQMSLQRLFCNSGPTLSPCLPVSTHEVPVLSSSSHSKIPIRSHETPVVSPEIQELESIIKTVQGSDSEQQKSIVQQRYAQDLMHSLDALKLVRNVKGNRSTPTQSIALTHHIALARQTMVKNFHLIDNALEKDVLGKLWYQEGGLWPCITPVALLEHLRSTGATIFGNHMKETLVAYGVSMTHLQRLMRMEEARIKCNSQGLAEEEENQGYSNWNPMKYPEWLLLQIDADFLIRPGQVDVALATIFPTSGANSVLQMNMGEGMLDFPSDALNFIGPVLICSSSSHDIC